MILILGVEKVILRQLLMIQHSPLFNQYIGLEQAFPLLSGPTYRSEPEASSKEQDKTPG